MYKIYITKIKIKKIRKFSTMDILVPISMKNAAKCDMQCELQNSASHQTFERTLRFRDMPVSMFVGVSVNPNHHLVV